MWEDNISMFFYVLYQLLKSSGVSRMIWSLEDGMGFIIHKARGFR